MMYINIINRCIIIIIKKQRKRRIMEEDKKNLLEVYTDKENVKYISDVCIEQLVFTKRGRQKVSFEPKGKFKWSNGNESTKSVCEGRRKHEIHIGLEREREREISEKKSVQEG